MILRELVILIFLSVFAAVICGAAVADWLVDDKNDSKGNSEHICNK